MKTSNKILMGLGVTLLLFPIFLTLLKNVENKKAPKVFNKYTYDYVPEKLPPFKHLKVVGSYHNMQLAFASSDSAFAFVPQDKSAPRPKFIHHQDTLIVSYENIKTEKNLEYTYFFQVHTPDLQSLTLDKSNFTLDAYPSVENASLDICMNESHITLQQERKTRDYKNITIEGTKSTILVDTPTKVENMHITLSGKSFLMVKHLDMDNFSATVSSETTVKATESLNDFIQIKT